MDATRCNALIEKLKAKGAVQSCHRCGGLRFEVVAESSLTIQNQPGTLVLGGPSVPVVIAICSKCGALFLHATKALE